MPEQPEKTSGKQRGHWKRENPGPANVEETAPKRGLIDSRLMD
jgi:hypothetical protein